MRAGFCPSARQVPISPKPMVSTRATATAPSAAALDQPAAEPRLELLDLVGQRRGADAEVGRGTAEMLLFGQSDEVVKQPGLNGRHSFDAIERKGGRAAMTARDSYE